MNEPASLESWSRKLDLRALRRRFTAPTYVLCEGQLRANFNAWVNVVGAAERICYPVKANPSLLVLELLARWGARAECASVVEIRLARLAGFPSERILYGTPGPDIGTARELLAQGGTVVVDSAEFLHALDESLRSDPDPAPRGKVLLRVNPSVPMHYLQENDLQSLTAHADKTGKFGVPAEDVLELLDHCKRLSISGLHTHVGTQMDHVAPHVDAVECLEKLATMANLHTRHSIEIIDFGGGLGIPFTPEDRFPRIRDLGEAVRPHFKPGFTYWAEPGHSLIGNAVGLLAGIVAKKRMRGRDWAIADVGTDQLAKVTLLKWWHQVLGPDGKPLPMQGGGSLGGPLCFSGDILLPSTDVSRLGIGDPIFVQHAGAYCAALGNSFNGRRFGGMALLREDNEIVTAAMPEREATQTPLATHVWGASEQQYQVPRAIDSSHIRRLSSTALKSGMVNDQYEFLSAYRSSERSFIFDIQVGSDIPFVTMPLLVRIAGDASIIASLLATGQEEKAFPVWGVNLRLDMPDNLPSGGRFRLAIDLSAIANRRTELEKWVLVRFGVSGTAIVGSFDLRFELPNPIDSTAAKDCLFRQPIAEGDASA